MRGTNLRRLVSTAVLSAAALGAIGLASAGVTREAPSSFACPNPKLLPLGKIYGANRGTSYCNDGASATVVIAGKARLNLVGGVCWRNRTNLEVGIGTLITNAPKKSDPAGLLLTDNKPGDLLGDLLDLSKGTLGWTGPVKVKLTGKTKGTFASTSAGTAVNGKLTGSFTCSRILDAPNQ